MKFRKGSNQIKKLLSDYCFSAGLIVFFALLLAYCLAPYYQGGKLILGQEGNNIFDFLTYLKKIRDTWQTDYGTGYFRFSINRGFLSVFLLAFLQKITNNLQLVNFTLVFSIYFLPFFAFFILARKLDLSPILAFMVSVFYVVNPLTTSFLGNNLSQWHTFVLVSMPMFFWAIFKFYNENLKLFFFFGLISFFLAFANVNPPLIAINQISIVVSLIVVFYHFYPRFSIGDIFKKYLLICSSFFLFNFWWIVNWFYLLEQAKEVYSKGFAISWLRGSGEFVPVFWRAISLRSLLDHSVDPPKYELVKHYSYIFSSFVLIIPFFLILYFFLKKRKPKKYQVFLGLTLVITIFFSTGVKGVSARLYDLLVMRLPFFYIFKSAPEKWGVLFIFLLALFLAFVIRDLKKDKNYRFILVLLFFYISYALIPYLSGGFLGERKFDSEVTIARQFIYKKDYQDLKETLEKDPEQYRVLILPGNGNYQVALHLGGNKFYTGLDPLMLNIGKSFLTSYSGWFTQDFSSLFKKISDPAYLKLLGFYNIRKILINKDMYPWFGFVNKESVSEIEEIFNEQKLNVFENQAVSLYDAGDNFLPRFYVPTQVTYSPQSTQYELPELVSFGNVSQRPALFISPYEKTREKDEFTSDFVREKSGQIVLVGELQSAIDEGKLRAGIRGMNSGGVLFPYARWKPGGLIYPYILKKEEKTKNQFFDQPEELLQQNLFFAGKRIFEIQKWDRKLNDKEFLDALKRYEKEVNEAIENLEKIRMTGKDTFWLLAKIEVSFEAFSQRLLDVVRGDFGKKSQRLKLAAETTKRIDRKIKAVLKHYSQARYYFEVPEEGEYEVLLEKKEEISDWKVENLTPKEEEKFTIGIADKQEEKSWFSFGKQKFNAGEYILALNQTPAQNLLNEDWNILESKVETGETTKLLSKKSTPTLWQEIKNWEPETAYKLSFKYKTPAGKLKLSLIEEKERVDTTWFDKGVIDELPDKTNILLEEELVNGNPSEWEEYSIVISSGRNVKSAKLFISSKSEEQKISEVEFKEVSLIKIIEPKMILRKDKNQSYSSIPQISFQKINPTKYVLYINGVSGPYFLVFSESFYRGWRAYIDKSQISNLKSQNDYRKVIASYFDGEIKEIKQNENWFDKKFYETWGKKALPDDRHLLMNGYANSWYITPADADFNHNYQIIIEYWPQRLFYIGLFISGITLMGCFSYLLYGVIKRRKVVKKFINFKKIKKLL